MNTLNEDILKIKQYEKDQLLAQLVAPRASEGLPFVTQRAGFEPGRPRVVADPRCLREIPIPALDPLG